MKEDFCQPRGYTGPYTRKQIRDLLSEADMIEGSSGKYRLNFGPLKNPHSEETYPTYDELCAQMWAARLCNHPELAWFNNPRDPGIVSNAKFTLEMFDQLPQNFKDRVKQIVDEDNAICLETKTIDEAVSNLIEAAKWASEMMRLECLYDRKEYRNLQDAIEDVELWLEGVAEANQTPSQMGWVGCNGQP